MMFGGGHMGLGRTVLHVNRPIPDSYHVNLPFSQHLNDFNPGQRIRIVATPSYRQESGYAKYEFVININTRSGDKFIQLNPRFHENEVVRNCVYNGAWQGEERAGDFPFQHDQVFTLDLIAEEGNIVKVRVDGNDFVEFQSHCDGSDVSQIEILGDLTVHLVSVTHNNQH